MISLKCNCNKFILGLVIGLILPVISSYLIFDRQYHGDYGFVDFMRGLLVLKSLGQFISISVLPNLIVFILVITYEKLQVARGLVIATLFWLLVVLVVKFIL